MFCSQCAHELAPSDVYCPKCAKPVASFNFDPGQIPQVEYIGEDETVVRSKRVGRPESRHPWWYLAGTLAGVAAVVILLVAAGVVGLAFVLAPKINEFSAQSPPADSIENRRPDRVSSPLQPTPEPTPQKPRQLLIDSRVPVAAGQLVSFDFETTSQAHVTGGFVTYGGSNDIDAYIVDDLNYNALVNGYGFRFVYGRPKAARSKIDVLVPAGRWHVVFSNKHALLTGKEVAAEVYFQEQ